MSGMMFKTGVYCILNLVNRKKYIGSASVGFRSRWETHRSLLKSGRHTNRHLQSSWSKHGPDKFAFLVIKRCAPEECIRWEQILIDKYKAAYPKHGYNITPTAGSPRGMKLTEEQKRKIGDVHRGKVTSEETKRKIGDANRGQKRPRTTEYCEKLSKALKGKKKSEEHRRKISEIMKSRKRVAGRWA